MASSRLSSLSASSSSSATISPLPIPAPAPSSSTMPALATKSMVASESDSIPRMPAEADAPPMMMTIGDRKWSELMPETDAFLQQCGLADETVRQAFGLMLGRLGYRARPGKPQDHWQVEWWVVGPGYEAARQLIQWHAECNGISIVPYDHAPFYSRRSPACHIEVPGAVLGAGMATTSVPVLTAGLDGMRAQHVCFDYKGKYPNQHTWTSIVSGESVVLMSKTLSTGAHYKITGDFSDVRGFICVPSTTKLPCYTSHSSRFVARRVVAFSLGERKTALGAEQVEKIKAEMRHLPKMVEWALMHHGGNSIWTILPDSLRPRNGPLKDWFTADVSVSGPGINDDTPAQEEDEESKEEKEEEEDEETTRARAKRKREKNLPSEFLNSDMIIKGSAYKCPEHTFKEAFRWFCRFEMNHRVPYWEASHWRDAFLAQVEPIKIVMLKDEPYHGKLQKGEVRWVVGADFRSVAEMRTELRTSPPAPVPAASLPSTLAASPRTPHGP